MIAKSKQPEPDDPREPKSDFGEILQPKRRKFLAAFAETGVLTRASEASGVARSTHEYWLKDPVYRAAFKRAKRKACDVLEAEAHRRAVDGVKRLKFHKGEPIIDPETGKPYFEHEYSDTLLIFTLKGNMPKKYRERMEHTGANGGPIKVDVSTLIKQQVARIKDRITNSDN